MVRYKTRLDAWKASPAPEKLEAEARLRDADLRPILRAQRGIRFYPEGNLVQIEGSDDYEPHERKTTKRGKIAGFSARARSRLITFCAKLNRNALPLFVTLTWPGEFSTDPLQWKRCLDIFLKRLRRAHAESSAIWKLEPQERGAPHYHLLVFGVAFVPHQLISRWWYEIVGSGDARHLQAGISIEAVKSREGVMHYASKLYMGKEIAGFSGVGRFWGVFNRRHLPLSAQGLLEAAEDVLQRFQRIARRYIQSQTKARFRRLRALGKSPKWRPYRCHRPSRIFTNNPAMWCRLLDWAEGKYYDDLAKIGQPF